MEATSRETELGTCLDGGASRCIDRTLPVELRDAIVALAVRTEKNIEHRCMNWESHLYTSTTIRRDMVSALVQHAPADKLFGTDEPIIWKTSNRWWLHGYIVRKGQKGTKVYWAAVDEDGDKTYTAYHLFSQYQVDKRNDKRKRTAGYSRGTGKRGRFSKKKFPGN
jgi:hypothetical protein